MDSKIITTFATNDAHYRRYYDRIIGQCNRLGVAIDARLIDPFGDYGDHCCYKPQFILDRLLEHKRTVLWIDADSTLSGKIDISGAWDVGWVKNPQEITHNNLLATGGVIAFQYTEAAIQFLNAWNDSCKSRKIGETLDHVRYENLLKKGDGFTASDITSQVTGKITLYGAKGNLRIGI